jgi:hypothetical protein
VETAIGSHERRLIDGVVYAEGYTRSIIVYDIHSTLSIEHIDSSDTGIIRVASSKVSIISDCGRLKGPPCGLTRESNPPRLCKTRRLVKLKAPSRLNAEAFVAVPPFEQT